MKKFFSKLIALTLALSVVVGVVSACDWITVNNERDLDQVVASVKIADNVESDNITKRQLKTRYTSYEYQYVYYYGYTESAAYELALKNLTQNRVINQKARIELAKIYNDAISSGAELDEFTDYFKKNALAAGKQIDPAKSDFTVNSAEPKGVVQYLTVYEYENAYYNAKKTINSMIDSYQDADEDETENETVTYTDRTAPASKENDDDTESYKKQDSPTYQERLAASATLGDAAFSQDIDNVYDLDMAVFSAYKLDIDSTKERKKAYNSMIKDLRNQGLIESEDISYDKDVNAILNYSYFKEIVKAQLESALIIKYQDSLITTIQAKLDDEAVWNQYVIDYNAQSAKYFVSNTDYETALDSATDTSPVLCNPFENYGYVSNILIPFSTEQKAALTAKQQEKNVTEQQINDYRKALAKDIVAYDQRSSWVYSNHGKYENGKFNFEDAYLITVDEPLNTVLSSYIGSVEVKDENGYTVKNDDGATVPKWLYSAVSPSAISYNDFVTDYLNKIGLSSNVIFEEGNPATVGFMGGYTENSGKKALDLKDLDAVKALTFAFSTDPGILSKEYGYLYSPYTSASEYVSEFAAAAKAIVEKGVGAYTVVLTDYGYHVMVCTKKVTDEYDVDSDKDVFLADLKVKGSFAEKYRQIKYDSLTNNEISKFVNKFISETMDESSGAITYYKDNYADLVTETKS